MPAKQAQLFPGGRPPRVRARRARPEKVAGCTVVVPQDRAERMSLQEAVGVATKRATRTEKETGFLFSQGHPTTPIFEGACASIRLGEASEEYGEIASQNWGDYHTHPGQGKCVLSPQDYFGRAVVHVVGCPGADQLAIASGFGTYSGRERSSVASTIHAIDRAFHKQPTPAGVWTRLETFFERVNGRRISLSEYLAGTATDPRLPG